MVRAGLEGGGWQGLASWPVSHPLVAHGSVPGRADQEAVLQRACRGEQKCEERYHWLWSALHFLLLR